MTERTLIATQDPRRVLAELRRFGVVVGCVFGVIGSYPLTQGREPRLWAVALAFGLLTLGVFFPKNLRLVHKTWMTVGEALGWVNTRLILGLAFFLVLTPFAVLRRILGEDRAWFYWNPDAPSYLNRVQKRPKDHLTRIF